MQVYPSTLGHCQLSFFHYSSDSSLSSSIVFSAKGLFLTGSTGFSGFFGLSPFPEEREKTQSAFGGKEGSDFPMCVVEPDPKTLFIAPLSRRGMPLFAFLPTGA